MPKRSLSEMFGRLAEAENQFLRQEFLAPVVGGSRIRVRIAGIVCELEIEPGDFRGWGIFQPASMTKARFVRGPTLREQQDYLRLFPELLLILCKRRSLGPQETIWLAMPAHRGDARFQIEGFVPVRLVEDAEQFDIVRARFDGAGFWYESLDSGRDLTTSAFLRESLRDAVPPEKILRRGLTPEEREAYALCWNARREAQERQERDRTEARLKSALAHAGAEFVDYLERADGYRVTYRVGERRMVTSVDKQDLSVQVAGICLSGQDQKFDLASLVGVLSEAGTRSFPIGRENQGMSEEDYWSMYRR